MTPWVPSGRTPGRKTGVGLLTGQGLVDALRGMCDGVRERLWVASPFVGRWPSVRRVLGRRWIEDGAIDVRLLTDVANAASLDARTLTEFRQRGEVRSLAGLHAKLYVADDRALLASANLTGTAFCRRHEIGRLMSKSVSAEAVTMFEHWWSGLSEPVACSDIELLAKRRQKRPGREDPHGAGLRRLWSLPPDPGDPVKRMPASFRDYRDFLRNYRDFARAYESAAPRIWPDAPLYFETDALLDYLFHKAPGTPSKRYVKRGSSPRRLSPAARLRDIRRHVRLLGRWLESVEEPRWREGSSRTVRRLLEPSRISRLSRSEAAEVAGKLNCMNARRSNLARLSLFGG